MPTLAVLSHHCGDWTHHWQTWGCSLAFSHVFVTPWFAVDVLCVPMLVSSFPSTSQCLLIPSAFLLVNNHSSKFLKPVPTVQRAFLSHVMRCVTPPKQNSAAWNQRLSPQSGETRRPRRALAEASRTQGTVLPPPRRKCRLKNGVFDKRHWGNGQKWEAFSSRKCSWSKNGGSGRSRGMEPDGTPMGVKPKKRIAWFSPRMTQAKQQGVPFPETGKFGYQPKNGNLDMTARFQTRCQ